MMFDGLGYNNNTERFDNSGESDFHFQEPDISIIGENFQYSKKHLGYPGRDKKLQDIENMDLSVLRTNLRKIRDEYDQALSDEGNIQGAINKLNDTNGDRILLQTPDFKIGFNNPTVSGLTISANNFHIENDSDLHFNLVFSTGENNSVVKINSIYYYFNLSGIGEKNDKNSLHVRNIPCNEPIVTEYTSAILYSYKQLVKFITHKYEIDGGGVESRVEIENIKYSEDLFLETMDYYLMKNNPDIEKKWSNEYIFGKLGLGKTENDSYFKLKSYGDKLKIKFHNTPFEIAEYRYAKISESVKQVNHILHSKHKTQKIIAKTKSELARSLEENGLYDNKLTIQAIKEVESYIKKLQEKGDSVESPIFLQYIETILKFKENISSDDIVNIKEKSYYTIIQFYKTLLKSFLISGEKFDILKKISFDKTKQKEYIIKLLNAVDEINIIKENEDGVERMLNSFIRLNKETLGDIQTYKFVYTIIIEWVKNSNHQEYLLEISSSYAKNVINKDDMPHLFHLITEGKGEYIENYINKCLQSYLGLLPSKLVDLIETILWQYSFTTTLYYIKELLVSGKYEKIDLSLLDQFANKNVYNNNVSLSQNIEKAHNKYRSRNGAYYNYMLDSIVSILKERDDVELSSLPIEELKKTVVGLLYSTFLEKYNQGKIPEDFFDMFIEYFNDEQKLKLEKEKLKYQLKEYQKGIEIYIQECLSKEPKGFEDRVIREREKSILGEIDFDEYDVIIENLNKYYDKNKIYDYKLNFQTFIEETILQEYYSEIQSNVDITIEKEKLDKILSYISKKEQDKFQKTVERIKVRNWVKKDSKAIQSGKIDIDTSKYQGINLEDNTILTEIKNLIRIKHKYDKQTILENKEVNIEKIIEWYDVRKEKLPKLIERISKSLQNLQIQGDKIQRLSTSFNEANEAITEETVENSYIEDFIKALEYYIDSLYIDIENLGDKENKILKNSIKIIIHNIYDKDNNIKNIKKIIKFLLKIEYCYPKDNLLLKNILELYDLDEFFIEKDLKYIHVLIGITENLIDINSNESETMTHFILQHIIKTVDKLDKENKLSYKEMEEIINKIKYGPIRKEFGPFKELKNTKFAMMLKYVSSNYSKGENQNMGYS